MQTSRTHGPILIVAEGDSLTYGSDPRLACPGQDGHWAQSASSYPLVLQRLLGDDVKVVNRGRPYDRSVDGLLQWQDQASGDVAILMFGTNDAFNTERGLLTPETFGWVLRALIGRRQNHGAMVAVATPPPLGVADQDRQLEPFRLMAMGVALEMGAVPIETGPAIGRISEPFIDMIHLTEEANISLAELIAARLKPLIADIKGERGDRC